MKKIILFKLTLIITLSFFQQLHAQAQFPEQYKFEESHQMYQPYRRLYYGFGFSGSYFAKKDRVQIDGNLGAYSTIEYRFSKAMSFGVETFYGWLVGDGSQYLSVFNPGIKIFPLAYRNPSFEPFVYIGGHALDLVYGGNRGKAGFGQGGFGGVGFRYMPAGGFMGFEMAFRASVLSIQRPNNVGGRALSIPLTGFIGIIH